jgi:hypothetical protein
MKKTKMKSGRRPRVGTRARQVNQPRPFSPGVTPAMVRQHALELYRDKLSHDRLTLEDWVLAEKDLVHSMETDGLLR